VKTPGNRVEPGVVPTRSKLPRGRATQRQPRNTNKCSTCSTDRQTNTIQRQIQILIEAQLATEKRIEEQHATILQLEAERATVVNRPYARDFTWVAVKSEPAPKVVISLDTSDSEPETTAAIAVEVPRREGPRDLKPSRTSLKEDLRVTSSSDEENEDRRSRVNGVRTSKSELDQGPSLSICQTTPKGDCQGSQSSSRSNSLPRSKIMAKQSITPAASARTTKRWEVGPANLHSSKPISTNHPASSVPGFPTKLKETEKPLPDTLVDPRTIPHDSAAVEKKSTKVVDITATVSDQILSTTTVKNNELSLNHDVTAEGDKPSREQEQAMNEQSVAIKHSVELVSTADKMSPATVTRSATSTTAMTIDHPHVAKETQILDRRAEPNLPANYKIPKKTAITTTTVTTGSDTRMSIKRIGKPSTIYHSSGKKGSGPIKINRIKQKSTAPNILQQIEGEMKAFEIGNASKVQAIADLKASQMKDAEMMPLADQLSSSRAAEAQKRRDIAERALPRTPTLHGVEFYPPTITPSQTAHGLWTAPASVLSSSDVGIELDANTEFFMSELQLETRQPNCPYNQTNNNIRVMPSNKPTTNTDTMPLPIPDKASNVVIDKTPVKIPMPSLGVRIVATVKTTTATNTTQISPNPHLSKSQDSKVPIQASINQSHSVPSSVPKSTPIHTPTRTTLSQLIGHDFAGRPLPPFPNITRNTELCESETVTALHSTSNESSIHSTPNHPPNTITSTSQPLLMSTNGSFQQPAVGKFGNLSRAEILGLIDRILYFTGDWRRGLVVADLRKGIDGTIMLKPEFERVVLIIMETASKGACLALEEDTSFTTLTSKWRRGLLTAETQTPRSLPAAVANPERLLQGLNSLSDYEVEDIIGQLTDSGERWVLEDLLASITRRFPHLPMAEANNLIILVTTVLQKGATLGKNRFPSQLTLLSKWREGRIRVPMHTPVTEIPPKSTEVPEKQTGDALEMQGDEMANPFLIQAEVEDYIVGDDDDDWDTPPTKKQKSVDVDQYSPSKPEYVPTSRKVLELRKLQPIRPHCTDVPENLPRQKTVTRESDRAIRRRIGTTGTEHPNRLKNDTIKNSTESKIPGVEKLLNLIIPKPPNQRVEDYRVGHSDLILSSGRTQNPTKGEGDQLYRRNDGICRESYFVNPHRYISPPINSDHHTSIDKEPEQWFTAEGRRERSNVQFEGQGLFHGPAHDNRSFHWSNGNSYDRPLCPSSSFPSRGSRPRDRFTPPPAQYRLRGTRGYSGQW